MRRMTKGPFRERAARAKARVLLSMLVGQTVALRRSGSSLMGLCPFHSERSPSFSVSDFHGRFRCFGCGVTGDALDWIVFTERKTPLQALQSLERQFSGCVPTADSRAIAKALPVASGRSEQLAAERLRRSDWARRLWQDCQPLRGSLAELYLRSRSIWIAPGPAIAFHPGLPHPAVRRSFPAMVASITDAHGRVIGIHRTFLDPDGRGKADVVPAKMMAGICAGGCVRLGVPGRAADHVLAIGEGIETSLSVRQATGLPVWAALSLSNIGGVPVPRDGTIRQIILLADADETDRQMAKDVRARAAENYYQAGFSVRIAHPNEGGDFNDMLRGET